MPSDPGIFFLDSDNAADDGVYAAVGRALVLATRFEATTNALLLLLKSKHPLKSDLQDETEIWSQEFFNKISTEVGKLSLHRRIKQIQMYLSPTEKILIAAKDARNEIAHDLTRGLTDALKRTDDIGVIHHLEDCICRIAKADLLVSLILSKKTGCPIPTIETLLSYQDRLVNWVKAPLNRDSDLLSPPLR